MGALAGHKRRLVGNTLLGLVQQGSFIVIGILLVPYLIYTLGAESYGVLLMVQLLSVTGLIGHVDIGFQNALIRYLAAYHAEGDREAFRRMFATGLALFSAIGLAGALIIVSGTLGWFDTVFSIDAEMARTVHLSLWLYAAQCLVYFPGLAFKALLAARQHVHLVRLWEIAERFSFVVILVVLFLQWRAIHYAVAAEVAATALIALFMLIRIGREDAGLIASTVSAARWSAFHELRGLTSHVFVNRLTSVVYQKGPEVLIGMLLGPVALAHFSIAMRIPRAMKGLQSAINSAVFPLAAAVEGRVGGGTVAPLVTYGGRYSYALLVPLMAVIAVFAEDVLRIWVGPEYAALANLLRGFIAWQGIMILSYFLSSTLTDSRQYRMLLPYYLLGNVLLVALGLALTARLELTGVMAALLASALVFTAGTVRVQVILRALGLWHFMRLAVLQPVGIAGGALLLALAGLRGWIGEANLLVLGVITVAAYTVYALIIWHFMLTGLERELIRRVRPGANAAG